MPLPLPPLAPDRFPCPPPLPPTHGTDFRAWQTQQQRWIAAVASAPSTNITAGLAPACEGWLACLEVSGRHPRRRASRRAKPYLVEFFLHAANEGVCGVWGVCGVGWRGCGCGGVGVGVGWWRVTCLRGGLVICTYLGQY